MGDNGVVAPLAAPPKENEGLKPTEGDATCEWYAEGNGGSELRVSSKDECVARSVSSTVDKR